MKHISLDHHDDQIKAFVQSLPLDADGSILELGGHAVLRVLPPVQPSFEPEQVKTAILRRRDDSRAEMDEWADADGELWGRTG